MEYFDMRKMSVNLWRNAAGETREICTFHRQNVIFTGVPALHPSRRMGSFLCFPAWKG
ncbi:acyl-CoA dehydrogenase [Escherichia coli]|nr:acyl-CoA dehydrogenase [Escherichia coli]